ncbi:MAG: ferrous iron transporter B, partial [Desulfocapsa sp.]|nr:ferrous iron transporter B [Desulfocapsa sp.]
LRGLFIHTWERTWQYIKKAGTVILGISILLWALMTFPGIPESEQEFYESTREKITSEYPAEIQQELIHISKEATSLSPVAMELKEKLDQIEMNESAANLKYSIAGKIGSFFEPLSKYAGFDWKTNIALLGGVAAKEVIISTLGTVYSMGEVEVDDSDSLGKRLVRDPNWNSVVAVSVLIFIMFYAPCFVTVVCIAKEASWNWAFFSIAFNTFFAFLASVAVFQIGSLFG